jgi:hypothetical protein
MKSLVRTVRSLVIGAVLGLALAASAIYGQNHAREPLGIAALITVGLVLLGCVVTFIGMRRPLGSRFAFGWSFFQRGSHPYQPLAFPDAAERWHALGQPAGALLGGWGCRGHCDVKLFVGEANGQRYYLYADATSRPWFQWSLGYSMVFGRDAPLVGVPVKEPTGVVRP